MRPFTIQCVFSKNRGDTTNVRESRAFAQGTINDRWQFQPVSASKTFSPSRHESVSLDPTPTLLFLQLAKISRWHATKQKVPRYYACLETRAYTIVLILENAKPTRLVPGSVTCSVKYQGYIESYFARLSFRSISSNGKRHQNSDLLSECALIEWTLLLYYSALLSCVFRSHWILWIA
jgi:hypothetical protein